MSELLCGRHLKATCPECWDAMAAENKRLTQERNEFERRAAALELAIHDFPDFQIGQLRHLYANAAQGQYDGRLLSGAIEALEKWNDAICTLIAGLTKEKP